MRVVHIITDLDIGGAEQMLYKLLSRIDQRRFQSTVISLMGGGELHKALVSLEIPVVSLGMARGKITVSDVLKLTRIVKSVNPDVIQGWMYHGNLAAQIVGMFVRRPRGGKIPTVLNVRGSHSNLSRESLKTAFTIWLGAKLARRATRVINNSYISARLHEEQLGYRPELHVIIPNGFDTNLYKPSHTARDAIRSKLGLVKEHFVIGHVANFTREKDHVTLLNASSQFLREVPDARLILVGREVDHSNEMLVSTINRLGIENSVLLMGQSTEIYNVAPAFDIATLSSELEGFPNVIGEAMACAVPCVVTDVGDCARVVADAGLVVPKKDPAALAAAWLAMYRMEPDSFKLMAKRARNRIETLYSLDAIVARYEDLYETVLQQTMRDC